MTQQDDITQRGLIERLTEIANRDSAVAVTVRADDLRALLSKLRSPVAESTDRAMLQSVLQDLEKSESVCPRCGYGDSCADMDVAHMIRDHLKGDASAPVADEKPDESNSPVPLTGHSMGPLTPIYDYVGSLIGQALATARHGAYEGSIVWTRMRHAGEWMPWHVAGKQSAPVAGEAQPLGYVKKGREWPNQCYYPSSHKPTDIHNWTPVFDHAAPQPSAYTGITTSDHARNEALEALEAAQRFIRNGIELGYIRMPGADTPDPAHRTPGLIDTAISALKTQADKDGSVDKSANLQGSSVDKSTDLQGDKDGGQQRAGDDPPAFMQSRMTPWGLLVRAGRRVLGTTLMDMSQALGMRPSELSAYECDRQRLTDDVILAVMRFFDERGLCLPATAWRKAALSAPQTEQGERDA